LRDETNSLLRRRSRHRRGGGSACRKQQLVQFVIVGRQDHVELWPEQQQLQDRAFEARREAAEHLIIIIIGWRPEQLSDCRRRQRVRLDHRRRSLSDDPCGSRQRLDQHVDFEFERPNRGHLIRR